MCLKGADPLHDAGVRGASGPIDPEAVVDLRRSVKAHRQAYPLIGAQV